MVRPACVYFVFRICILNQIPNHCSVNRDHVVKKSAQTSDLTRDSNPSPPNCESGVLTTALPGVFVCKWPHPHFWLFNAAIECKLNNSENVWYCNLNNDIYHCCRGCEGEVWAQTVLGVWWGDGAPSQPYWRVSFGLTCSQSRHFIFLLFTLFLKFDYDHHFKTIEHELYFKKLCKLQHISELSNICKKFRDRSYNVRRNFWNNQLHV